MKFYKVGFIINPISGMGGSVGLKGTDGKNILKNAIDLGAKPSAIDRAREFLHGLESIKNNIIFITCPRTMGETVLKECNYNYELIDDPIFESIENEFSTDAQHTKIAAKTMALDDDLKIILFVGGDGTARDIVSTIGTNKVCLGIPSGVKIYSSVFATSPTSASHILIEYLFDDIPLVKSEVLDIDEDEYRQGHLCSQLFGHLIIPFQGTYIQHGKEGSPLSDLTNQERIAKRIIENLEVDVYYLLCPGTTIKAITDKLNMKKTLLGVDLLLNNKIIDSDLNENKILEHIMKKKTKIITTITGKQGFLFGRGNLQISPNVIKSVGIKNIIIISTRYKLRNIENHVLKIDTRDSKLDKEMKGFYKVIIDYDDFRICKVE